MAAAAAPEVESMMASVALECGGDISASQEEILARSPFLGGDNALPASDDEDEEVFATPPDATQQQHDDSVTMCTLPFTPSPAKSPASPSDAALALALALAPPSSQPQSPESPASDTEDDSPPVNPRRKPRVCIRKVRGARIRTPTPSPKRQEPEQSPQPEQPIHANPLLRAVLMIPTITTTAANATTNNSKQDPLEEFLALARQKGLI